MILITGGAWQGKMDFALKLAEENGIDVSSKHQPLIPVIASGEEDSFEAALERPVINGLHLYIKRLLAEDRDIETWLLQLKNQNPHVIITINELGCGIVPIDPVDRAWREASGRGAVQIAKWSEGVYRMVCGIPTQIK